MQKFKLSDSFLAQYETRTPPFGFKGLGELVYVRTYSRLKENGVQEVWWETVRRVVEGTYNMQKKWIIEHDLGWSDRKAQRSAQEMYDRIFNMKFLPPGRGLWAMGSPLTEERGLFAALNNCAFTSTKDIVKDKSEPFTFLMDALMLGIGVGFDTLGAGQLVVSAPSGVVASWAIPDSREGWVESLRRLLEAYLTPGTPAPVFDYSLIRPEGSPIKGFGGVASGPEPLRKMHHQIESVLKASINAPISVTAITDIMNMIGQCVVAGNVRRSAEIAFGEAESDEFMDLKDFELNPQRSGWAWASNNSIFAKIGMNYSPAARRVANNGEPGFAWLDNMRNYGRMISPPDFKDYRVAGGNPCLEQSLEPYELCCLVETFPANHTDLDDYKRTLKFAYLYAKTVTLGKTPWTKTNRVLLRNRRIGLSQSGIVQAISKLGIENYRVWCEEGYKTVREYDDLYSEWFTIPRSIKVTSVKPSGTVSLLAGATPGMHWPEDKTHIRRIRLSASSELLAPLRAAGYHVEPEVGKEDTACVVSIPVKIEDDIRALPQVSMWEQLSLAAFLQKYWADNQVSATVTFQKHEAAQIEHALQYFQYQLKGVSFLPFTEEGAYAQMPYQGITEEEYNTMVAGLKPLVLGASHEEADQERYCDGDSCLI